MRIRPFVFLLPLLAIVACGGDDDDAVIPAADTTTTTEAAGSVAVHVEPDGIDVGGERVPFGATRNDVTAALGQPTEEGEQEECPAGPASFLRYDKRGLLLVLQDDQLAGWSLDADSALTTSAGIGIGSSKADLEAAYGPVEIIPDSTLGIEFLYDGGVTGLLDADAPDGTITAIWSGVACVFR